MAEIVGVTIVGEVSMTTVAFMGLTAEQFAKNPDLQRVVDNKTVPIPFCYRCKRPVGAKSVVVDLSGGKQQVKYLKLRLQSFCIANLKEGAACTYWLCIECLTVGAHAPKANFSWIELEC